jgi:hypothetical protein
VFTVVACRNDMAEVIISGQKLNIKEFMDIITKAIDNY